MPTLALPLAVNGRYQKAHKETRNEGVPELRSPDPRQRNLWVPHSKGERIEREKKGGEQCDGRRLLNARHRGPWFYGNSRAHVERPYFLREDTTAKRNAAKQTLDAESVSDAKTRRKGFVTSAFVSSL